MTISHKLNLIFIHVHRTGGTTLKNLLLKHLDKNTLSYTEHGNAKTVESSLLEKHADYYTFGFTRNPWERILSWYLLIHKNKPQNLATERKNFETFLELDAASDFSTSYFHYNSLDYFTNKKGELKVDKIYRYENIDNNIRELFNKYGLPLSQIPILNASALKNYQQYYTTKSQRFIAQKCKKDIERFDYSF